MPYLRTPAPQPSHQDEGPCPIIEALDRHLVDRRRAHATHECSRADIAAAADATLYLASDAELVLRRL